MTFLGQCSYVTLCGFRPKLPENVQFSNSFKPDFICLVKFKNTFLFFIVGRNLADTETYREEIKGKRSFPVAF